MAKLITSVTPSLQLAGSFTSSAPRQGSADAVPLYLASRGIHGTANITYDQASLPVGTRDVVKVSLHGSSLVRVPYKGPMVNDRVQRYVTLQSPFLDLVDVSPVGTTTASANQVAIDFNFVLPRVVSYLTEGQEAFTGKKPPLWSSLPSSLSTESIVVTDIYGGIQRVHATISYTIRVEVFRRNKSIGYTSRGIRIYDDVEVQPPVCIADFPSDYQCQQKKTLKRNFFMTGDSFSALAAEPPPFVFCNSENSASTTLPINFEVHIHDKKIIADDIVSSPRTFDVFVTWRLKSLTFLSMRPLTSMPTMVQSLRQSSVNNITVIGQPHRLRWTLVLCKDYSSLHGRPSNTIWTEAVNLPLFIYKPVLPAPPLFTPFVSRRYSISMQIRLVGTKLGNANVRLEVPVQIAYQQEKGGIRNAALPPAYGDQDEHVPEYENHLTELPIYVP